MLLKNKLFILLLVLLPLCACSQQNEGIHISSAKMTTEVITSNQRLVPLEVTNSFPEGTQKVSCWFQWKSASENTQIIAHWYFVTDNIHILDLTVSIPRKEGSGGIALTMPQEKNLPVGNYRVDLTTTEGKVLRSLHFSVGYPKS